MSFAGSAITKIGKSAAKQVGSIAASKAKDAIMNSDKVQSTISSATSKVQDKLLGSTSGATSVLGSKADSVISNFTGGGLDLGPIGGLLGNASGLIDKYAPGIKSAMPDLKSVIPDMTMPDLNMPNMDTPNFEMPNIDMF